MPQQSQWSLTFQYLYFLRFSLILWLFPFFFALADSGRLPIATQALTRGIFVPEYMPGYICVAFFLVCKGFAALVAARTVVVTGKERFDVDPPDWLKVLLVNDGRRHELKPVLWAQGPNALTLLYIILNGIGEEVPAYRVIWGSIFGVLIGLVFCYLLNAWYYLSYQPDEPPRAGDRVRLGHNAARTILFPRRIFWLKEAEEEILDGRETLEDIRTDLREDWFAKKGQQLVNEIGDEMWRRQGMPVQQNAAGAGPVPGANQVRGRGWGRRLRLVSLVLLAWIGFLGYWVMFALGVVLLIASLPAVRGPVKRWAVRTLSFTGYIRVRATRAVREAQEAKEAKPVEEAGELVLPQIPIEGAAEAPTHVSSIYETHLFSFVATATFGLLFWVLDPLTAPEPSGWTQAALVAVLVALGYALWIFQSGECNDKRLCKRWKVGLSLGTTIFFLVIPVLYAKSGGDRFPTLATVLLLIIVLGWGLTLISFYFDRFRVPVLVTFLVVTALPHVLHFYWGTEEHYVSTVTPKEEARAGLKPPTPAEILDARLKTDADTPLVIVTATGGGLHASAWMAHVMKNLEEQVAEAAKKDFRQRAKWTSLSPELLERIEDSVSEDAKNKFRDHILLMSTVSGGSVGLSYYLREIDPQVTKRPAMQRMVFAAQCSSLEAVGWGLVYYDLQKALILGLPWLAHSSPGEDDLDGTPIGKDRTWALRKGFERNSSDGYCLEEATDTEHADEEKYRITRKLPWWRRLLFDERSEAPRQTLGSLNPMKKFPAFTMNTTTAEAGDRFLLANYRLPGYPIGPIEGRPAESFLDLLPAKNQPDLPLASAAQLSATFPYVSSAARIPKLFSVKSDHFVDGGYYDNDGTVSAIEFLRYALTTPSQVPSIGADAAEQEREKTDSAFQAKVAATLGAKKTKLKVLLIEIRNDQDNDLRQKPKTAKALDPGKDVKPSGASQQIVFPLQGFWSAGHDSVTGRNRNGLDLLVKENGLNLELHEVIFDDAEVEKQKNHFLIAPAKDPLSWSLTPLERREVKESSQAKGRLKACYQDVVDWLDAGRWAGWNANDGVQRCP